MIILPAIDIKDGNCVRLVKGEFGTAHKVAESPFETAWAFNSAGAAWMHMVDLDGAKTGERANRDLILRVVQSCGLKVEVGGGIRDIDCVRDYLNGGASRVILGSAALENKAFVKQAVTEYGEQIAVGIDARDGKVATRGWLDTSDVSFIDFAKEIEQIGVKYMIFTDISCDGTLEGPNFEQLEAIQNAVSCNIIASGGIRDIGHIRRLSEMGLYGAICGKSIYSGTLNLNEAVLSGGAQ
jgi:phosphoribosylformimino-5-aminoimidazole carboxamide ribotide isomerase